jgi:hypothetical protein
MAFDQADYFLIPLLDGQFGVGQILELADTKEGAPFCGISARRASAGSPVDPLQLNEIVAFVRVSPSALVTGTWPLAGFDQIPRFRDVFDFEGARALGFADTPVRDPAVIEAFVSAWHGLYAWDAFGEIFEQIKRQDLDRPAPTT